MDVLLNDFSDVSRLFLQKQPSYVLNNVCSDFAMLLVNFLFFYVYFI